MPCRYDIKEGLKLLAGMKKETKKIGPMRDFQIRDLNSQEFVPFGAQHLVDEFSRISRDASRESEDVRAARLRAARDEANRQHDAESSRDSYRREVAAEHQELYRMISGGPVEAVVSPVCPSSSNSPPAPPDAMTESLQRRPNTMEKPKSTPSPQLTSSGRLQPSRHSSDPSVRPKDPTSEDRLPSQSKLTRGIKAMKSRLSRSSLREEAQQSVLRQREAPTKPSLTAIVEEPETEQRRKDENREFRHERQRRRKAEDDKNDSFHSLSSIMDEDGILPGAKVRTARNSTSLISVIIDNELIALDDRFHPI